MNIVDQIQTYRYGRSKYHYINGKKYRQSKTS